MGNQIDRSLEIIEVLAETGQMDIEELCRATKIPRSTIFKILKILENNGYVFSEVSGKKADNWYLTLKMLKISRLILSRLDLKNEIRHVLVKLSKDVNEIVQLGVLNNKKIMYIDIIKKPDSIISFVGIGKELDINISAAGMVVASALEENELENLLNSKKFPKNTEYTLTDPKEIKKELVDITKKGFAYDDQQYAIGVRCLAAPVYNFEGKIIAAINITSHISTMTDDAIDFMKDNLLKAASRASKIMGYENDKYLNANILNK